MHIAIGNYYERARVKCQDNIETFKWFKEGHEAKREKYQNVKNTITTTIYKDMDTLLGYISDAKEKLEGAYKGEEIGTYSGHLDSAYNNVLLRKGLLETRVISNIDIEIESLNSKIAKCEEDIADQQQKMEENKKKRDKYYADGKSYYNTYCYWKAEYDNLISGGDGLFM